MKKVLVTGAGGFVGRQALPLLEAAGYEVHAVTTRAATPDRGLQVRWHRADLHKPGEVEAVLDRVRPSHLLHLAWYAVPGKFWTSVENFNWVRVSLELFQAFASTGGQRVVGVGTCAEYEWEGESPRSETETRANPATTYGTCKHALHLMLDALARERALSAAWGRVFFMYGPHERPQRLVASVARSLLRGEPALCSHGGQLRDFLHVEDVARAFVALLDSEVQGAVNIASGTAVAVKDVIFEIGKLTGRSELIRLGALPLPADEPRVLVADVKRLHAEVGWRPTYELSEGLAGTIEWWRQNLENPVGDGDDS